MLGEGEPAKAKVAAVLGGSMQVLVCMSLGAGLLQTIDTWVGWFDLTAEGVVMLKELRLLAYFYWFGIASTFRHDHLRLSSAAAARWLHCWISFLPDLAAASRSPLTPGVCCCAACSGLRGAPLDPHGDGPRPCRGCRATHLGTALGMGLAFDVLGLPQFSGAMGLWIGCDLGYVFLILALLLYCKTPSTPLGRDAWSA